MSTNSEIWQHVTESPFLFNQKFSFCGFQCCYNIELACITMPACSFRQYFVLHWPDFAFCQREFWCTTHTLDRRLGTYSLCLLNSSPTSPFFLALFEVRHILNWRPHWSALVHISLWGFVLTGLPLQTCSQFWLLQHAVFIAVHEWKVDLRARQNEVILLDLFAPASHSEKILEKYCSQCCRYVDSYFSTCTLGVSDLWM
jgi:hypothetical protein